MNIKLTIKKEYEAPQMSVVDYEYGANLLDCSNCEEIPTEDAPVYENKPFG